MRFIDLETNDKLKFQVDINKNIRSIIKDSKKILSNDRMSSLTFLYHNTTLHGLKWKWNPIEWWKKNSQTTLKSIMHQQLKLKTYGEDAYK